MLRLLLMLSLLLTSTFVSAAVQKVISLSPHATEIAYAAGLGDKLIAVSDRSDYPEQANQLEKVANYQGIKLERIIALQPDLIIAWPSGNPPKELEKLKQFGFNIYYSHTDSLKDIARDIEQLSQYSTTPAIGQKAAADFRQQLNEIKRKYNTQQPVRYFYQLSEQPIISVAQGKWPSEVFHFCGGENVFANASVPYPQIGIEQVLIAQPEVIFIANNSVKNDHLWLKWQDQLSAVKNQQIWRVNSDWLNRPTPRTLLAVEQVCQYFEAARQKR